MRFTVIANLWLLSNSALSLQKSFLFAFHMRIIFFLEFWDIICSICFRVSSPHLGAQSLCTTEHWTIILQGGRLKVDWFGEDYKSMQDC